MTARPHLLPLLTLAAVLATTGCERLGIQDPARVAAEREAEGKAVGAGCRHAGRSLEDCFSLNERAPKAAVFAGWKDMNDYMASNKIDVVPSQLAQAPAAEELAAAPVAQVRAEAGRPNGAAGEPPSPAPPRPPKH